MTWLQILLRSIVLSKNKIKPLTLSKNHSTLTDPIDQYYISHFLFGSLSLILLSSKTCSIFLCNAGIKIFALHLLRPAPPSYKSQIKQPSQLSSHLPTWPNFGMRLTSSFLDASSHGSIPSCSWMESMKRVKSFKGIKDQVRGRCSHFPHIPLLPQAIFLFLPCSTSISSCKPQQGTS